MSNDRHLWQQNSLLIFPLVNLAPLKKKLNHFGEVLALVIFWICVVVWAINYPNYLTYETLNLPGVPFSIPDPRTITVNWSKAIYYLKIAVALAVAAIPEGLPAVITTCLALGTRTMAKKNAIVRKLPSVETLGCTTVICSDKTGTLTTNQMSVVELCHVSAPGKIKAYEVTGHTFNPHDGSVTGLSPTLDPSMAAIAQVCAVCSEASLESNIGIYKAIGAPTEAALKVLVEKMGATDAETTKTLTLLRESDSDTNPEPICLHYASEVKTMALLEFDRDRKSMSVLCAPEGVKGAVNTLLVKGAAECVLERCNRVMTSDGKVDKMTEATRKAILSQVQGMAESALRCLAFAKKDDLPTALASYDGSEKHPARPVLADPSKYSEVESNLVFLGLAGLKGEERKT